MCAPQEGEDHQTINRQDIWLAIEIRGRDHIGGKTQLSDVGATSAAEYTVADAIEKTAVHQRGWQAYAVGHDWCAELRASVAVNPDAPKRAPKVKPGMHRVRRVLKHSIHGIAKAAFCRMARRGGRPEDVGECVRRKSGGDEGFPGACNSRRHNIHDLLPQEDRHRNGRNLCP